MVKRVAWLVAAPLVVFWRAVVGQRVLAPIDGYRHYLPLHVLAARMLRAGHLPVWNPYTFSGYPLLATNQAAVLYPPHWAFVVLPAVAAPDSRAPGSPGRARPGSFATGSCRGGTPRAAFRRGLLFPVPGFLSPPVAHPPP